MMTSNIKTSWEDFIIVQDGLYLPKCANCQQAVQAPENGNLVADDAWVNEGRLGHTNWRFAHKGPMCTPREGVWYAMSEMLRFRTPITWLQHIHCDDILNSYLVVSLGGAINRIFQPVPQKRLPHTQTLECNIPTWRGVYIAKCLDRYKIGKADNIRTRIAALSTAAPYDIEFIHGIRVQDPTYTEKVLHARFAAKRVRGEWFELDDSDVAYLLSL